MTRCRSVAIPYRFVAIIAIPEPAIRRTAGNGPTSSGKVRVPASRTPEAAGLSKVTVSSRYGRGTACNRLLLRPMRLGPRSTVRIALRESRDRQEAREEGCNGRSHEIRAKRKYLWLPHAGSLIAGRDICPAIALCKAGGWSPVSSYLMGGGLSVIAPQFFNSYLRVGGCPGSPPRLLSARTFLPSTAFGNSELIPPTDGSNLAS